MRIQDPKEIVIKNKKIDKISFLTYNIWFDPFYQQERYQVIMRILDQSDADFICL